jgi:hypothetical protein
MRLKLRQLALPAFTRLGKKKLAVANTLAYGTVTIITTVKVLKLNKM